jgi:hypothetical protein
MATPAPRTHYFMAALENRRHPDLPKRKAPTLRDRDKTVLEVLRRIRHNLCLKECEELEEAWYSVRLSAEQYLELYYAINRDRRLSRLIPDKLHYDWSPPGTRDCGELVLRRPSNRQKIFTASLDRSIDHAILRCDAGCIEERQLYTKISPTGSGHTYLQTPSGIGHKDPEKSYAFFDQRPRGRARVFIIEVGTGKKSLVLRDLATAYIQSGTQLVLTVDLDYRAPDLSADAPSTPAYCVYRIATSMGRNLRRHRMRVDAENVVFGALPEGYLELKTSDFLPRDTLFVDGPEDGPIRVLHADITKMLAVADEMSGFGE